jgi:hypothetical protein
MRVVRCCLAAALCAAAIGCAGDKLKRQPLAGTAKFKSKDVQFGSVRFEPAEGQATTASADIRAGKFAVAREAGLSPGKYKVWVQAFDRIPEPQGGPPGSEGPAPRDILPPQYTSAPAAEINIQVVPNDQPNTVTLDLK